MAAPAPSPVVNTIVLSDDGVYNFSNFADNVDLANFFEALGDPIRMWAGNDSVTGANVDSPGWDNQVNGNIGSDSLSGGIGRDKYLGGKESDGLFGNDGQDWLNGNNGADGVYGGAGNDIVRGGRDNDFLAGGTNNDILIGDFGRDTLFGEAGNDRFVMRTDSATIDGVFLKNTSPNAAEADVIGDFANLVDKIVLPGISSFSDLEFENTTIDGFGGTLVSAKIAGVTERICFVRSINVATLSGSGGANFVVGGTANDFLQKASDPNYFLQNPNMATDLIPV
jgi:Ca2+-binding RTX toxin-like protein